MMIEELNIFKKRIFGRKKLTLQSTKNDIRGGRLFLSNPDNSITALVSFGPLGRMLNYNQGLREYARVMKKSAVAAIGLWLGKTLFSKELSITIKKRGSNKSLKFSSQLNQNQFFMMTAKESSLSLRLRRNEGYNLWDAPLRNFDGCWSAPVMWPLSW